MRIPYQLDLIMSTETADKVLVLDIFLFVE